MCGWAIRYMAILVSYGRVRVSGTNIGETEVSELKLLLLHKLRFFVLHSHSSILQTVNSTRKSFITAQGIRAKVFGKGVGVRPNPQHNVCLYILIRFPAKQ